MKIECTIKCLDGRLIIDIPTDQLRQEIEKSFEVKVIGDAKTGKLTVSGVLLE